MSDKISPVQAQLSDVLGGVLPKGHTSVSYAIIQGGKIIAADALGTINGSDKKPATTDCTYNVASISKIYCAVAVMQLVEQNKVNLDVPVVEYLPKFKMMDERYTRITLRHCLAHTSGLPGTQWRGFAVSSTDKADYYADVYDYLSKSTLKDEPGAYAVYCNDGFTVAEMVVAAVSGESYHDYCKNHITEPIGAESSRLAYNHNPANPLVSEGTKPQELPLICGGAGFTTSMLDLCKFGQNFLEKSKIISEESKIEMAKMQGRSFLLNDDKSRFFGLGWDNMSFHDPDFDFGEGVLIKGGNSFQFNSRLMIVPKYNAVVAISATHDCKIDVGYMAQRLLATALLEQGICVYKNAVAVPQEICEKFAGTYLTPYGAHNLHINGAQADFTHDMVRGGSELMYHDLRWIGDKFVADSGQEFFFEEQGGDKFIVTTMRGSKVPMAMHAKSFENESKAWEDRVGKSYIVMNTAASDLVIYENFTGFEMHKLPGYMGVYVPSFSGRTDSGVYNGMDATVRAIDDNIGRGFLRTPGNPSRDLMDPIFHMVGHVEYCDVASYGYVDVASLEEYAQQEFPTGRENSVFKITKELKELPQIPDGHRIMVMGKDMVVVYDSLFTKEFAPVKEGYISLI